MKPWQASSRLKGPPMSTPDEAIDALLVEIASPRWRNWRRYDEFIDVEEFARSVDYVSGGYWVASTTMERET